MKRVFRNAGVGVVFAPLIALVYLTAAFCGKERAVTMLGPFVTALARLSLKLWVPQIETAEQFDEFPSKMKKNMRLWRLFYDIRIVEETKDRFKLNIANCPFCEVLQIARLSGLAPYVCQGDWDVADANRDRWIFEREYQIGTGDPFCDHGYRRKK